MPIRMAGPRHRTTVNSNHHAVLSRRREAKGVASISPRKNSKTNGSEMAVVSQNTNDLLEGLFSEFDMTCEVGRTLFGHKKFQFNHQGNKKGGISGE